MDSEMDTDSEDVQEWIPAKSTKLKDFKKRKISEDNHYNKQNVNANTDYIPVFEHNKPIRSYADVTKQTCTNSKDINSDINTEETSDIKELLKQSIKNTEIITTMIMEQNSLLKQQTQQITAMLQLLTKTLLSNK
ncbi:hypothetical protein M0802_014596 [Mischocyttarus mexicanus]|nr:hypothetical protein M0802_014596 [Mischocyttarus mexicanus]